MIQNMILRATALAAALVVTVSAAQAQTPTLVSQEKDWGAYVADVDGGKTCYILAKPTSQEPKGVNRDPTYFFVTARPKDGVRNQVSVSIGYPFGSGSKATVEIGSEAFSLFTENDKAWVENVEDQDRLVAAMRAGSTMTVKGTSQRGTNTTDSYSLSGVTAAFAKINESCQ